MKPMENIQESGAGTEKLITFRSVLSQSWGVIKSLFKDQVLSTILLLIALAIPLINAFAFSYVVIVAGRKLKGESNPFAGSFKIYFSKFWQMMWVGLVFIGMLLWQMLKWVGIPLIILGILTLAGVKIDIIGLFIIPFMFIGFIALYKYMYGWVFSLQTLFFEDKKGMSALKRSWELTYGNKWKVFFYFMGAALIPALISIPILLASVFIFGVDLNDENLSYQLVQYVLNAPIWLFLLTFLTTMYVAMKDNFGNFKMKLNGWLKWLIIAFITLIPIGILAGIVLTSLSVARQKGMDALQQSQQNVQTEDGESAAVNGDARMMPFESAMLLVETKDGTMPKGEATAASVKAELDKNVIVSLLSQVEEKVLIINGESGGEGVYGMLYMSSKNGEMEAYMKNNPEDNRAAVNEAVSKFLASDWAYFTKNFSNFLGSQPVSI